MPIDIDGFGVLGAMAANRQIFAALGAEVSDVARALVVKQLKDKALTSKHLGEIAAAIGHEDFDLIVDNLSDAEVKALVNKIDKHSPEAKADSAAARRTHVSRLAKGEVQPSAVAAKSSSPERPPKPAKTTLTRAGADGKFTRAKGKSKSASG